MNTNLESNKRHGNTEQDKERDTICIWLQNPSGAKVTATNGDMEDTFFFMKTLNIDIWAIPETKLPWAQRM
eukprot:13065428-Ditylum_brightwellii.AAC.1